VAPGAVPPGARGFRVAGAKGRVYAALTHPQYAKAPLTCIFVTNHGYCALLAVVR